MKKGQIEMIGLVIVVLLLVIGGLLYLKFGVLDKKEAKNEVTLESAYVVNTLTAIRNVNVCESSPVKMQQAINACINEENICGTEACEFIKSKMEEIMVSIGISKQYKYSLYLEKKSKIVDIKKQCEYGTKADIKTGDISSGYYTINLQIC